MINALKDFIILWDHTRIGVKDLWRAAVIKNLSIQHVTWKLVSNHKDLHLESLFGPENTYLMEKREIKPPF